MPKILTFGQYILFFWIAENGEPVHVHVAIRRPGEGATKFWLTAAGGCILASNGSEISEKDLRDIAKLITFNHGYICNRWREVFGESDIRFYR